MNRSSYGERDYAFGQLMLTLRTHIGLTQAGLAELLHVSRRAEAEWEAGSSYPKVDHLKRLIALGVRASAFAAGREEEEIRALWRAAHQKVLLDERWLSELLGRPSPSPARLAEEQVPGAGQGSALPSKAIALWTVPSARNPHFTGRDELLDQLMQQLSPTEPGQPMALRRAALTQAQVIKGLGGIGKTQIAVEYAYRARELGRYTHTLWIMASSEEAILMSFAALAELLPGVASAGETEQRKLVAAVIRWLEQCKEPWLLIVDNADDLSLAQPYLPLRGNGSVLLTTRASAVGWLAPSLEVDTMGMMEGIELLLRRAQRFAGATEEEINEAGNLVAALAQFPLALDQAGAYIEETGCSLGDYLQLYQAHRRTLLAWRGRQATRYPASVATTWGLSFQRVEQTNPAAADLLRLCAFLAPDAIPEELLTGGAPYWPAALQEAVTDRLSFNQMLEALLAFSLVKRLAEDRLLSIHRLVQVVQQERLSAEEQGQWAERLVRAVHVVFPHEPQEVASWQACLRYLDQVQACDTLIREQRLLLPEAAELLDWAGTYLCERALYSLAEPLYQQSLSIWEQQAEPQPASKVQSLNHLADLYVSQGKYAAAESLYHLAVPIIEQQVGAEHPLLVDALKGLAHIYSNEWKFAMAEPLYQRALHMWEQQGGPEHPLLVNVLTGLAFVQMQQGKYAEAELLQGRALRIRERQLGPEHIQVAFPLLGLAQITVEKGEYARAEPLIQRALRIRERQLGPEHPLVAMALHALAEMLAGQGNDAEAEPLFQRALRIREEQLGQEHPDVAQSLRGLANLYTRQGKYMEAEPLYVRALRIVEQRLGPEHLETASVLHDFAGFQQVQGRTQEAAIMYQRALTTREHVLGPDHQLTLDTRARLQEVLVGLGQMQEAAHVEAPHKEEGMAAVKNRMPEE